MMSSICLTAHWEQMMCDDLSVSSHSGCGSMMSALAVKRLTFSSAVSRGLFKKVIVLTMNFKLQRKKKTPHAKITC